MTPTLSQIPSEEAPTTVAVTGEINLTDGRLRNCLHYFLGLMGHLGMVSDRTILQ